jgi:hypothetical protein
MSAFLARCQEDLGVFSAQGLPNLLCLAAVGHRPGRGWLSDFGAKLERLLPQVRGRALVARLSSSAAQLGCALPWAMRR